MCIHVLLTASLYSLQTTSRYCFINPNKYNIKNIGIIAIDNIIYDAYKRILKSSFDLF